MLLHNSYINVAIANILLYHKSLYDLPVPKGKNPKFGGNGVVKSGKKWYFVTSKILEKLVSRHRHLVELENVGIAFERKSVAYSII